MKRLGILLFFATAVLFVSSKAGADDYHKDNYQAASGSTSAVEMSVVGLAAASATGAVAYLVRRRKGSRK